MIRNQTPFFMLRYVDDILIVFKTRGQINHFINRLKAGSVLKFTYEPMVDNRFNFLGVGILINGDGFIKTTVTLGKFSIRNSPD